MMCRHNITRMHNRHQNAFSNQFLRSVPQLQVVWTPDFRQPNGSSQACMHILLSHLIPILFIPIFTRSVSSSCGRSSKEGLLLTLGTWPLCPVSPSSKFVHLRLICEDISARRLYYAHSLACASLASTALSSATTSTIPGQASHAVNSVAVLPSASNHCKDS